MNIDFKEQYQHYSTVDLIKITLQPQSYQTAAVIAATEILEKRSVTEADREEAEKQCNEELNNAPQSGQLINAIKGFYSMPYRWVNVILTIAVLQYLQVLYNEFVLWITILPGGDIPFKEVLQGTVIDLLFLPVVMYIFYIRERWGWILLFVSKLYSILPGLFFYFDDKDSDVLFPLYFINIIFNLLMAGLLWNKNVRSMYNITEKVGWFAVLATFLLLMLMYFKV